MPALKFIGIAALAIFQLFSLAQLWSAVASGAIYVRKLGMITVDVNHAAWTQHLALYLIGAGSLGFWLFRQGRKRFLR
ncbi:MAG: hypothetical protein ACRCYS_07480 [Beijerinckiaceae bacterium]